jgi:hypothetical protein
VAIGKKSNLRKVPRAVWDFSQCPKDELSFCAAYEYLREVAMAHRERFRKKSGRIKWTPEVFAEVFKGYFHDGKRVEFKGIQEGMADPFEINLAVKQTFALAASGCSGFPDAPYLSVNAVEREAWIKAFGFGQLRPDRPTMAQKEFFEIQLDPSKALENYQFHIMEWARQNLTDAPAGRGENSRKIVDHDSFQFELGVIRLNWSLNNKRLVKAFEKWLQTNRPKQALVFETRGTSQPSDSLKYLSAMRLLTVMTATQASDHTHTLLGTPLYWTDDNWYEARDKARSVMRQISSPFFNWA